MQYERKAELLDVNMWASPASPRGATGASDGSDAAQPSVDLLFPRRPRRASPSGGELRRRPLPPAVDTRAPSGDLWTYDASAKPPPGLLSSVATHGVIGSSDAGARLLWNRPAPEEEEREEEALPSYLSYLQPHASPRGLDASSPLHVGAPSLSASLGASSASYAAPAAAAAPSGDVDASSRNLAHALQELIQTQLQGAQAVSSGTKAASPCCEALQTRVEALERQLATRSAEQEAAREANAAAAALADRVSTLEGRQSAFQSQLAQIAKVLGVPVGKAGKHSQLKTLVQSLHEQLDAKLEAFAGEMKAQGASQARDEADAAPVEALPSAAVLGALAEEHEAALARLNAHLDERLRLESSQRVALEGRVYARQAEQEEWLQQLEGACCGSRFEARGADATEVNVAHELETLSTQMRALQAEVASAREVNAATSKTTAGLKQLVEKVVRDTGAAETLLQQYVSTITHQVASVTRQYVSVRIRDNNRLLDATLRARVPAYARSERDGLLLVRPEAPSAATEDKA